MPQEVVVCRGQPLHQAFDRVDVLLRLVIDIDKSIDKTIPENIDIDKDIFENICIEMKILQNIDINKVSSNPTW